MRTGVAMTCLFLAACGGSATTRDPGGAGGDVPGGGDVALADGADGAAGDRGDGVGGDATDDAWPTDAPLGTCPNCGTGTLTGLTCAPNETTAIPNVVVWIDGMDCCGQAFHLETESDAKGVYAFENVPAGQLSVQMSKGSFANSFDVTLGPGQEVKATGGERCFKGGNTKIAVISGEWDRIEGILTELKLPYTLVGGNFDIQNPSAPEAYYFLRDAKKLGQYGILFIDCSDSAGWIVSQSDGYTVVQNLQDFVKNGGSIYASDYAWDYLTQAFNSFAVGGGYTAPGNTTFQGVIVDPKLEAYVGASTLDVHYGLGPLNDVESAGAGTTVHVEGEFAVSGKKHVRPLVMSFTPYPKGGRVIYTTFHNDEQGAIAEKLKKILNYLVFMM